MPGGGNLAQWLAVGGIRNVSRFDPEISCFSRPLKSVRPHLGPATFTLYPPHAVALLGQINTITGKFDMVFAGAAVLRTMGYDTKVDICGHGFRAMACSALVESGLWSETAIERQMSHKERNNVRAAYTHKAEFLEEHRMIMTWWSRFLEANREDHVTPHEFATQTCENVTRLRSAKRTE